MMGAAAIRQFRPGQRSSAWSHWNRVELLTFTRRAALELTRRAQQILASSRRYELVRTAEEALLPWSGDPVPKGQRGEGAAPSARDYGQAEVDGVRWSSARTRRRTIRRL